MPDFGNNPPSDPCVRKLVLRKYELGRLLGCGSSAKVYLARNLRTGQARAIKCFNKLRVSDAGLANLVKREVSILQRLRHPNIIRLHEVLASRSKIYVVLDLVKGGDLFTRVAAAGRLPEDLCRRYFRQLIAAVGYCHSHGVFHRDLKLENLLLDETGSLKVSDFGLSAVSDFDLKASDALFHTLCGTPAYVAPEILAKKGYRPPATDIWSCGVILFTLAAGYLPFNDPNLMMMYRKIYRGEHSCPKWTSPELRHLIDRLLDKNPDTRIAIEEIQVHPWFRKGEDEPNSSAMTGNHEVTDKVSKAEAMDAEGRELNAFDIIGFSPGADLSRLFSDMPEKERLITEETPEAVLLQVEAAGRSEGLVANRRGEKGQAGVALRRHDGNLVVGVEVYRLTEQLTVLEVEMGRFAERTDRWAGEFWKRNPLRDRITPVVDSIAGTTNIRTI